MRVVKLIAVNLAVFLALVLLVNLVLAIAFETRSYVRRGSNDPRADLTNYAGQDWARTHFEEYNNLKSTYRSYYGWRRQPFDGETITVDDAGLRRTVNGGEDMRIGFFGGSAMWGTGARDAETIPSLVAKTLGAQAVNFGESSWRAHQSLNQLMEAYIAQERFDVVVFYDGANEVANGCREELAPFTHVRQDFIARRLKPELENAMRSFFTPILRFTVAVARRVTGTKTGPSVAFDCSRDPEKTAHIARMLLADWDMAHMIAARMGARFIGALQPVAYFSDTPHGHLDLTRYGPPESEFRAVYPVVRERLGGMSGSDRLTYIDMTDVLDTADIVYIDFVHLSPNGNAIVADRLSQHIERVLEMPIAAQ